MRICFDTNVIVDIMGKTADFPNSYAAYDTTLMREFDPCISLTSLPDIVYLLKQRGFLDKESARASLADLFTMFEVLDAKYVDCKEAYESAMSDFEDALIAFIARRNKVDFIVTRNKKDFLASPVPALTPQEFLETFCPPEITYSML